MLNDAADIKRFLRYFRPYKWQVSKAAVLLSVSVLLSLPMPLLSMYIIDHVLPEKNISLLLYIVAALLFIMIINLLVSFFQRYFIENIKQRIMFDLHLQLFNHVQRLPIETIYRRGTGYLMSRITADTGAVNGLMTDAILGFFKDAITLVVGITMLFLLHWKLTILSLLLLPFFIIAVSYNSKRLRKLTIINQENNALLVSKLQELVSGIFTVRIHHAEKTSSLSLAGYIHRVIISSVRLVMNATVLGGVVSFIGSLGSLLLLGYGGMEIIHGNLTLGKYMAFGSFLVFLFGPTQGIMNFGLNLQRTLGALKRIYEILDTPIEKLCMTGSRTAAITKGEIEFRNVGFHYQKEQAILNDINCLIKAGSNVALVGQSGAGKTTFVNLLLGLYEPQTGGVYIDHRPINEIDYKAFRQKVAIVPQDNFLFSDSIINNVRLGKPDALEDEIILAAKAANAHDFIMQLPQGYRTILGERGCTLSGGQRQRIAIARAMLRNPRILILDEATSQIDSESEKLIKDALSVLMAGRTTIIIAHRLSTIAKADKIIILNNRGEIEAEGKHNYLLKKSRTYRKLCEEQFTNNNDKTGARS